MKTYNALDGYRVGPTDPDYSLGVTHRSGAFPNLWNGRGVRGPKWWMDSEGLGMHPEYAAEPWNPHKAEDRAIIREVYGDDPNDETFHQHCEPGCPLRDEEGHRG